VMKMKTQADIASSKNNFDKIA
jgi:hypothetical protein